MNVENLPPEEIERRFLIVKPSTALFTAHPEIVREEIEQIYLLSKPGTTHRVRKMKSGDAVKYTETLKTRIDKMSVFEQENDISEETYFEKLKLADKQRRPIVKERYVLPFAGFFFEIDVYPFWSEVAVMEVEVPTRETVFDLPPELTVLTELTGRFAFSNAALAKEIPDLAPYADAAGKLI